MNRFYCENCNMTLKRNATYAMWDAYGIKYLKCKFCGKPIVSIDRGFEDMADELSELKKQVRDLHFLLDSKVTNYAKVE